LSTNVEVPSDFASVCADEPPQPRIGDVVVLGGARAAVRYVGPILGRGPSAFVGLEWQSDDSVEDPSATGSVGGDDARRKERSMVEQYASASGDGTWNGIKYFACSHGGQGAFVPSAVLQPYSAA
jgi:hypothetical protein